MAKSHVDAEKALKSRGEDVSSDIAGPMAGSSTDNTAVLARSWKAAFLACVGLYFGGVAFNNILIPWIVRRELHLDAAHLGIAQASLTLPMACLVLVGGALADRANRRSLLAVCYGLVALAPLGLGLFALYGRLSFPALITALVVIGALGAVLNPTRDAMLVRVSGGKVQAMVSAAALTQFAVQALGYAAGAILNWFSVGVLLLLQSLLWLLGAFFALRLPNERPIIATDTASKAAVKASWSAVWPALVGTALISLFSTSAFLVVIPLVVLDRLKLGATGLTLANLAFCIGTIVASIALTKRGVSNGHGAKVRFAFLLTCGFIALLAAPMPFLPLLLVLLVYGGAFALSMMLLKTIVQTLAHPAVRGRVLSVYNLAFIGGGSLGSAGLGLIVQQTSIGSAAIISGVAFVGSTIVLGLASRLFTTELEATPQASS